MMMRTGPRRLALALCSAMALAAVACGDDDDAPSPSPSPSATTTATTPAASATATTPAATATPTPSPTPTPPPSAAEQARNAAVALTGGVILPDGATCDATTSPQGKPCIGPIQNPEPELGIALIGLSDTSGMGAVLVMGDRGDDAGWGLWYVTQNQTFHLLALPGEMAVCADGDGLNVRSEPSNTGLVVTTLSEGAPVRAEGFRLVEEAPYPADGTPDAFFDGGWYRISSPAEGWVHGNFVADAQSSCDARDEAQAQRG